MTTTRYITPTQITGVLRINAEDGRQLLAIHPDGSVTGELEDASEAAAVFVREIRRGLSTQ